MTYLADSFLPQIKGLAWTEHFSPYDWYLGGEPLINGVQWADVALLVAVSAAAVTIGTWRFTRRDIA